MSVIWRSPSIHGQHPGAHAGQLGSLEHRRDTTLTCMVGPLANRVGDPVGQLVALGGKGFRGLAEEHRRGGGAHQSGAVRLVERLQ